MKDVKMFKERLTKQFYQRRWKNIREDIIKVIDKTYTKMLEEALDNKEMIKHTTTTDSDFRGWKTFVKTKDE